MRYNRVHFLSCARRTNKYVMHFLELILIAFLCCVVGFIATAITFAAISQQLIPCLIAYVVGCSLMHKFLDKMDRT